MLWRRQGRGRRVSAHSALEDDLLFQILSVDSSSSGPSSRLFLTKLIHPLSSKAYWELTPVTLRPHTEHPGTCCLDPTEIVPSSPLRPGYIPLSWSLTSCLFIPSAINWINNLSFPPLQQTQLLNYLAKPDWLKGSLFISLFHVLLFFH